MSDPSPAGAAQRTSGIPAPADVVALVRRPDRRGVPRRVRRGGHRTEPQHRPGPGRRRPVERDRDAGPDPAAGLGDVRGAVGAGHPARSRRLADVLRRSHRRRGRELALHRRGLLQEVVRPLHPDRQRPARVPRGPGRPARRRHPADQGPRQALADPRRDRPVVVHRQQGPALPRLPDPGTAVVHPAGEALRARPPDPGRAGEHVPHQPPRHRGEPGHHPPRRQVGDVHLRRLVRALRLPDLLAAHQRLPRLVTGHAEAAALDGQQHVRPGRRRRGAAARRSHAALLPRVDVLPRALPVPGRLEQGPAPEAQGRAGVVRRQPAVVGRRQAADRELDRRRPAAAPTADPEPHADAHADADPDARRRPRRSRCRRPARPRRRPTRPR